MTPPEIEQLASRVAAAFVLALQQELGNGNGKKFEAPDGPRAIGQVTIAERESIILLVEPPADHPKATPRAFAGPAIQLFWHRKDRWTKAMVPREGLADAPIPILTQLLPHLDEALETLQAKRQIPPAAAPTPPITETR